MGIYIYKNDVEKVMAALKAAGQTVKYWIHTNGAVTITNYTAKQKEIIEQVLEA